jgi:hypothetical protein
LRNTGSAGALSAAAAASAWFTSPPMISSPALFAKAIVEPRKVDGETLAHLRAAMSAIQFRSRVV